MGHARGRSPRRCAAGASRGPRHIVPIVVGLVAPLTLFSACSSHTTLPTAPEPAAPVYIPPKVVIISIDGLRPEALSQAGAPTIMSLAAYGSSTLRAQTTNLPVTLPAHTSMLSG